SLLARAGYLHRGDSQLERACGWRMSKTQHSHGATCIVIGGGVTGLSAAWWLARDGVDTLVIEAGPIGWAASGRNGGGCSHHHSPLFREEQRLWPLMDELLGYPTEFQPNRIRIALDERQFALYRRALDNGARQGYRSEVLDPKQVRELVPLAGDNVFGGYFHHFGGHANPHRTLQAYACAMRDCGGRLLQHTRALGFDTRDNRVVGVRTSRGTFACDHIVIAGARDRRARLPPGSHRAADERARRDDRDGAAAVDEPGRRGRQRSLWTTDIAWQPGVRRRPP